MQQYKLRSSFNMQFLEKQNLSIYLKKRIKITVQEIQQTVSYQSLSIKIESINHIRFYKSMIKTKGKIPFLR